MVFDVVSRRRRQRTGPPKNTECTPPVGMSDTDDASHGDFSSSTIHEDDGSHSESQKGHDSMGPSSRKGVLSAFVGAWCLWNPCRRFLQCSERWWASGTGRIFRTNPTAFVSIPRSNGPKSKDRSKGGRMMDTSDYFLMAGLATFVLISLVVCLYQGVLRIPFSTSPRRWTSDDDVNRISLEISLFDFDKWNVDMGGWQFFHHFFIPQSNLYTKVGYRGYFGGLEFVGPFGKPRVTRLDEGTVAEFYLAKMHNDTGRIDIAHEHADEIADIENSCRRNSWMQSYKPLCNAMHELDLTFDFNEERAGLGDHQIFDSYYISHGYWRDVWVVHQRDQDVKSILKKSRWTHKFNAEVFSMTLNDALIMERLTKSPRIVDVYGHCAYSVWVEAIPFEVESVIIPGDGYSKQEDLRDTEELKSKNDFSDEEKLRVALTMAESLADLHGFEDGLM
jgi:hypothetical protein